MKEFLPLIIPWSIVIAVGLMTKQSPEQTKEMINYYKKELVVKQIKQVNISNKNGRGTAGYSKKFNIEFVFTDDYSLAPSKFLIKNVDSNSQLMNTALFLSNEEEYSVREQFVLINPYKNNSFCIFDKVSEDKSWLKDHFLYNLKNYKLESFCKFGEYINSQPL